MFDIGFAELLLIAVVSLLVLGPERLPGTVRTVAMWLGRIKRQANEIRREIEREIDADGIRRDLYNEKIMAELEQSHEQLNQTLDDARQQVEETVEDLNQPLEGDTADGEKSER